MYRKRPRNSTISRKSIPPHAIFLAMDTFKRCKQSYRSVSPAMYQLPIPATRYDFTRLCKDMPGTTYRDSTRSAESLRVRRFTLTLAWWAREESHRSFFLSSHAASSLPKRPPFPRLPCLLALREQPPLSIPCMSQVRESALPICQWCLSAAPGQFTIMHETNSPGISDLPVSEGIDAIPESLCMSNRSLSQ